MSKSEDARLTIQPDRSKILMSDSLKDVFADSDPFPEKAEQKFIIIALDRFVNDSRVEPILGTLVSLLLDKSPEVEVRVSLPEAFSVIRGMAERNYINELQLHYGDDVISLEGPYEIEALRTQDINVAAQTCVLAMKLTQQHT